jgi:Xaa-Pro aminopeptidase
VDRSRLREALAALDSDALLVVSSSSADPDLAPFTGGGRLREAFVVVSVEGKACLGFLNAMEREEAALSDLELLDPAALGVSPGAVSKAGPIEIWRRAIVCAFGRIGAKTTRVALAGRLPAGVLLGVVGSLRHTGWSFVDGRPAMSRLRRRKSEKELAAVRRTAQGTCTAFRRAATILAEARIRQRELWWQGSRLTVGALRSEIGQCLAGLGLEQPEGSLLAPGAEGAVPHNTGSNDRVLRGGESIVVDLFPRGDLFADCTRTFCIGRSPQPLRKAHAEVHEALSLAHAEVGEGVRGSTVQENVCRLFCDHGRETPLHSRSPTSGYVHGLGHGVGYELHEDPHFRDLPGSAGSLQLNDVFTLEPGLYDPQEGYAVRLEDLLILGPEGPEILTDLPYDLDPRAWLLSSG